MKAILTALTGLIFAAATPSNSHAAEVKTNHYVLTNKALTQSYSNLVVLGDVDVTLVQGTSNQLTMEGYQNQLENVTMEVKGNTLYVSTKEKVKGKNPLVYIPVSNLEYLKVQGNSNVTTLGYLRSNDILIELASECNVQVKSSGRIAISDLSAADYVVNEWVVEKI